MISPPSSVATLATLAFLLIFGAAPGSGRVVTVTETPKWANDQSAKDGLSHDTSASTSAAASSLENSIYEFYPDASRYADLKNTLFTFYPTDKKASSYTVCKETQRSFPVQFKGERVHLHDEGFANITSSIGRIPFFGHRYKKLFLHSNGYITYGEFQWFDPIGLAGFFGIPKVAAAASDFDPSIGVGKVFFAVDAVEGFMSFTFRKVSAYSLDGSLKDHKSTFQIVLYKTGVIQLFYKSKLDTPLPAISGLSTGDGLGGQSRLPPPTELAKVQVCPNNQQ